jgi:microcin C transport system permease protein
MLSPHLSPLAQRRWHYFKKNKRGYYSLILFTVIFILTMGANFIANDRPLLLKYHGEYYTPVFKDYNETIFGGDFDSTADYRDAFIKDKIEKDGWIIWAPIRFDYQTINYNLPQPAPSPPTRENWLGTDDQARDVAARLIYGVRISLLFGLILAALSSVIGVAVGAVQGFFGGWIDLFFQRFIEIWQGVPVLFLIIIISSVIQPSFFTLLGIMLVFSWMSLVGVVRAEFLRTRNFDYVRAARALGVSSPKIMFRHILPNAMVATLTMLPFILTAAVTTLTSLDFLGFGLPPGSASLGELLSQGKNNLDAPWLGMTAFFSLAIMLTLMTFIGEAVRDAFDPRKAV